MKHFAAARKFFTRTLLPAGALCAVAVPSFAISIVDYSTLGTSVTAELTPAIAAGLPIMGIVLAVGVGLGVLKKMVKA